MDFSGLNEFITAQGASLKKGPIAIIFVEDDVEVESTLAHHIALGFKQVLVLAPRLPDISDDVLIDVTTITFDPFQKYAVRDAINLLMPHMAGSWVFTCFNAEYLYFPFSESRSFGELVEFHTEERRDSMLTYVVDAYARDLTQAPDGVDRENAFLDKAGYYALARPDPETRHPKERQLDFFGGLKWRYEEFVPYERRKIDRIAIFKARADLKMSEDFCFSDEEYNTYACPWHNNITAALLSFRTAKALRRKPTSREAIDDFTWVNSARITWTSQQLLDLGLIEPGQWF